MRRPMPYLQEQSEGAAGGVYAYVSVSCLLLPLYGRPPSSPNGGVATCTRDGTPYTAASTPPIAAGSVSRFAATS